MRRDTLLALVLFALALWQNLASVETTEFHRDEARWIHRARFLGELRDPLGTYWHDRELMRGQPPLGSILMGVGLVAQGRDLETNGFWNFTKGEDWNRWHGRMPERADLVAARRTNSVVGAFSVVVAFFIGRRLSNRVGGVAAGLFLIPHPLSVYLHSLAGSDALLTLLAAAAALAAIVLADRPSWWRAALLGALIGLGGATKLSPLLLVAPLAGVGALLLLDAWRRPRTASPERVRLGWWLLSVPATAAAAFVAAFPFLWPDPVGRTLTLFRFRAQEMAGQSMLWEELAVPSRAEALRRVGFWLGDTYSTTGWLASTVAGWFRVDWHPAGIDLPLALVGALIFAGLAVRHGFASRHALAGTVLGGQVGVTIVGMRADFERYHLPILFAVAVCVGLLAGSLWAAAARLLPIWSAARRPARGPVVAPATPGPVAVPRGVAAVRQEPGRTGVGVAGRAADRPQAPDSGNGAGPAASPVSGGEAGRWAGDAPA